MKKIITINVMLPMLILLNGCKIISEDKLAELSATEKQQSSIINIEQSWQKDIPKFAEKNAISFAEFKALNQASAEDLSKFTSKNSPKAKNHIIITDKAKILETHLKKDDGSIRRDSFYLIDFFPYDGKADAKLQMGPIFKGLALRDSMPFMKFENFANQIDYAQSSRKIHVLIEHDLTKKWRSILNVDDIISLTAVSVVDSKKPLIFTPIKLEKSQ